MTLDVYCQSRVDVNFWSSFSSFYQNGEESTPQINGLIPTAQGCCLFLQGNHIWHNSYNCYCLAMFILLYSHLPWSIWFSFRDRQMNSMDIQEGQSPLYAISLWRGTVLVVLPKIWCYFWFTTLVGSGRQFLWLLHGCLMSMIALSPEVKEPIWGSWKLQSMSTPIMYLETRKWSLLCWSTQGMEWTQSELEFGWTPFIILPSYVRTWKGRL